MAISFPTELDTLTNPQGNSPVSNPSHAQQHADANDAIEALEIKVGVDNSTDPNSLDYRVVALENASLDPDEVQDITADLLAHPYHTNLTAQYDDDNNRLLLSVAPPDVARTIYQTILNETGTNLTKGQPVYVSSSVGASGKLRVSLASASSELSSSKTFGILAENILDGAEGQVITEGLLTNVNTVGANDGDAVYLGSTPGSKIYGYLNKPQAPNHLVTLGIVVRGGQAQSGSIFVKIQNGFEVEELHNVKILSPQNGDVIIYNSTTGLWENSNAVSTNTYTNEAIATHNDDTTNVHGIANTQALATKTYVDDAVSNLGNTVDTNYVPISILAQNDGVATLDAQGHVPAEQLDIGELVEDYVVLMLNNGTQTRISYVYDDLNNSLSLTATYDDEEVLDAVATALTAGTGITKAYDDNANTITVSVDTNVIATQDYVDTAISNLIDGAPGLLDTLNELAAAIGDDSNFVTTMTNALATKASITQLNTGLALKPDITALTHSSHDGVAITYDSINNKVILNVEEPIKVNSTPPANPAEGDSWYENDTGILYVYDGTYWIEVSGGNGTAVALPTAFSYIQNVTSDVQSQLNTKAPINNPTFTGTVQLPVQTSIGQITANEIATLYGIQSSVQGQLDDKAPKASPTFTGTVSLPETTSIGNVSNTEISYINGVTSAIQDQLDLKSPSLSPTFIGTVVLPSTTSIGNVDSNEISYLNGVTSSIQNQLDSKLNSSQLLYANLSDFSYSSVGSLPSAGSNNGKVYYVTADGYLYYSDGSSWIKLAKSSDVVTGGGSISINSLTDVDTATIAPAPGQTLSWNGTNWVPTNSTNATAINDLTDVDTFTNSPQQNQVLIFNGTQWVPGTVSSGASAINDLSDVDTATSAPTNGQTLTWNGTNWVPSTVATVLPQYPAITVLDVTNNGATSYQFNNQYSGDNPTIYAISGTTIAFNLNVTGHPFLIRTSALANYNTGLIHVATNGTVSTGSDAQGKTSGTLYWQIPATTTGGYRYQCSIHSGMVGTITIKDVATI